MTNLNYTYQASVLELARSGNFRAIAYWLNSQLVPQGIYVHVQAAKPGCLRTLVEFQRMPDRNRLIRFICHQIWRLESELIEGVQIIGRPIGESKALWQQSIRIPTRSERQARHLGGAGLVIQTTAVRSQPTLPPQLQSMPKWLRLNLSSPQQLKLVRSFLLGSSAIAAFLMGIWLESITNATSPSLPVLAQKPSAIAPQAPTISAAMQRPELVTAALETVAVIRHDEISVPQDPTVTLMFGGEVSPESLNVAAADAASSPLADIPEYSRADLSIVSLSEPLASAATTLTEEYYHRSRPDSAKALRQSGIDLVNLANNQAIDYGESGLLETLRTLDRAGIYHMGAGRDVQEARRPEIVAVKGQRIAYLGYTGSDWGAASDYTAAVDHDHYKTVADDIQALRSQVDWIVVNYRWGDKLAEQVEDWQKDLARFAIDQGADVVVGYHPRILQGAEIYKDRPIVYSLGDFIFGDSPYSDYDSAVLKVSLSQQKMKVELLPVAVKQSLPKVAEGDRAEKILKHIEQVSQDFEQPMQASMVLDIQSDLDQPLDQPEPTPDGDGSFIETPAAEEGNFIQGAPSDSLDWEDLESLPLEDLETDPSKLDLKEPSEPEPTFSAPLKDSSEEAPLEPDSLEEAAPFQEVEPPALDFDPAEEPKDKSLDLPEPSLPLPAATDPIESGTVTPAPLQPIGGSNPEAGNVREIQTSPAVIQPVEEPIVGPLAQDLQNPAIALSLEYAREVELQPLDLNPSEVRINPLTDPRFRIEKAKPAAPDTQKVDLKPSATEATVPEPAGTDQSASASPAEPTESSLPKP